MWFPLSMLCKPDSEGQQSDVGVPGHNRLRVLPRYRGAALPPSRPPGPLLPNGSMLLLLATCVCSVVSGWMHQALWLPVLPVADHGAALEGANRPSFDVRQQYPKLIQDLALTINSKRCSQATSLIGWSTR